MFASVYLVCIVRNFRPPMTPIHVPSRSWPPSIAARLAQNAPISREAVNHIDNLAAALRA